MKNRRIAARIRRSAAPALLLASALGGCASSQRTPSVSSFSPRDASKPLVLAAPSSDARAAHMQELLESPALAGRLDSTMGAPGGTLILDDVTSITVYDQQYTWNGRMYDSYANMRSTSRLLRR